MSEQNYVSYPILHNSTLNQNYFTFPVDPLLPLDAMGNTYSLYINYTQYCPPGYFIWDYFSSGELFINLSEDQSPISAKATFITLYKNFLLKPNKLGSVHEIGTKPFDFVTSVKSPTSENVCAWMLSIEKFFDLQEIAPKSLPSSLSICSFLTINDTNKSVLVKSDHYSFANVIDNVSVCSCPELASSNSYTTCTPATLGMSFAICPKYSPKKELIKSTLVTLENTENSFVLAMEYSLSEKFNHQFDIHAIPSVGEVTHVFSLTYPLTESYDELLPSVFDVYQEFLNNYVNSVSSNSDSTIQENTALEKPSSYISSLISV